ncbi:MAG: hypothetical protein R3D90_06180 [Paracoccaceae bacterium]
MIAAHGLGAGGGDRRIRTRPARSEGYFGDLMRLLDGPVLALA